MEMEVKCIGDDLTSKQVMISSPHSSSPNDNEMPSMVLDNSMNSEAEQPFETPSPKHMTVIENKVVSNEPHSCGTQKESSAKDETNWCQTYNGSEYPTKRSNDSDYVRLKGVHHTSHSPYYTTPTAPTHSDGKYTENNRNQRNGYDFDYKIKDRKDDKYRTSLYRTFDPLVSTSEKSFGDNSFEEKKGENSLNELTDLWQKWKISETPKRVNTYETTYHSTSSPKPDVLAFAVDDNNLINELKKKIENLENNNEFKENENKVLKQDLNSSKDMIESNDNEIKNLKQELNSYKNIIERKDSESKALKQELDSIKDVIDLKDNENENLKQELNSLNDLIKSQLKTLNENEIQMKSSREEINKLFELTNCLHFINEELVINCTQSMDKVMDEKMKTENRLNDLNKICDQLKNELSLSKDSKGLYLRAVIDSEEVEAKNSFLQEKCLQMEREINALKAKDSENVTLKLHNKKCEMKINSLENQLLHKTTENTELSAMVDELIKARK